MVNYKIVVKKIGKIKNRDVSEILKIIHECYERSDEKPLITDLYIFESRSRMVNFLNYMSGKISKTITLDVEKYYALHDAWSGIPRIMVSTDIMKKLPYKVAKGAILHEAAHSILHGKLTYYVLSCPRILKENFNEKVALQIVYLLSVALKDYEATDFLLELNFIDEQISFIRYLLKPTQDEIEEYALSNVSLDATAIAIASILKIVMCSLPLAEVNREIRREVEYYVNRLLPRHCRIVYGIIRDFKNRIRKDLDFIEKIRISSEIFVSNLHCYSKI